MLNEMMHRPVVMEKVLNYLRENQRAFTGGVKEIEDFARQAGIPIIPHETAKFIDFLCAARQPQTILEIGTAIGFSASLMAQHLQDGGHLTTIDRYPLMYERAKKNFEKNGLKQKVTLLEGDAADILPNLEGPFDLIFMDSAKAKYVEFLPYCMNLLDMGGILLIDDIFQGGTVFDAEETVPRKVRKIHRGLNNLLDLVLNAKNHRSCLLPLGDGLLMIRKESATNQFIPN